MSHGKMEYDPELCIGPFGQTRRPLPKFVMDQELAEFLELRARSRLSNWQVALAAGRSGITLSLWICGRRAMPPGFLVAFREFVKDVARLEEWRAASIAAYGIRGAHPRVKRTGRRAQKKRAAEAAPEAGSEV